MRNYILTALLAYLITFFSHMVDGQLKARDASFCINHNDPNLKNGKFSDWATILKNGGQFYVDTHLNRKPTKTLKYLDKIEFSKIRVNAQAYTTEMKIEGLDEQNILAGGNELQQWIHIMIKAKRNIQLEGLYVQAIHGPVGIPVGQFTGFQHYADDSTKRKKLSTCQNCIHTAEGFISIPCSARSLANIQHPSVYLFHYGESNGKKNEIHLNFNFIDVICSRSGSIQFLIIAVLDFKNGLAEVVKTDVYSHSHGGDFNGVAYPYYPDFQNVLLCDDSPGGPSPTSHFQILKEETGLKTGNLRYNYEYDECIRQKMDFGVKPVCPPGPFKCEKYTESAVNEATRIKTMDEDPCDCVDPNLEETPLPPSSPVQSPYTYPTEMPESTFDPSLIETGNPETTAAPSTTSKPAELRQDEGDRSIALFQFETVIEHDGIHRNNGMAGLVHVYHGKSMFFAFCISLSIATFASRFFKETCTNVNCGDTGIWLWIHILFSFISFAAIWVGLIFYFLMKPIDDSKSASHVLVGVITISMFHINFIIGWGRPVNKNFRFWYIITHLVLGYGSKLLAIVSMILAPMESDAHWPILWIAILTEIVNIVFYFLGSGIMFCNDKQSKGAPKHKVCPVPEQREYVPKSSLLNCCLIILLPLHVSIQIILFVIALYFWQPPIVRYYKYIINLNLGS